MKALPILFSANLCALLVSCATYTELGYKDFNRDLGGGNELNISTYPAGFPSETRHTPYVSSATESADKVYFQVLIRGTQSTPGIKPDAKAVAIESFSYKLDEQPWVTLVRHHPGNFWMHGNPNYDKGNSKPVPYHPDSTVRVRIELSLWGKNMSFEGEMPAHEKVTPYPLPLRNKGI